MAYYNYQRKSGTRTIAAIIAFLIFAAAFVAAWAIGSEGFTQNNPLHFFNDWGTATAEPEYDMDGNEIELTAFSISEEDYEAYGIPRAAQNAKSITCTIKPANASDKRININFTWDNSNSDWAKNKSVFDYIGFEAAENYGNTFAVWTLKPFAETIICTVSSRSNPDINTTIRLEYVARLQSGFDLSLHTGDSGFDIRTTLEAIDEVYTVLPTEILVTSGTLTLNEALWEYLRSIESCSQTTTIIPQDFPHGVASLDKFTDYFNNSAKSIVDWCYLEDRTDIGYFDFSVECYYGEDCVYTGTFSGSIEVSDEMLKTLVTPVTELSVDWGTIVF